MPAKKYVAPAGYSNAEDVQRRRSEIESANAVRRANAQKEAREGAGVVTSDIAGTMVAEGLAKMPVPAKPAKGADIVEQYGDMDKVMNIALHSVNAAHAVKAQTRPQSEPTHEALVSDQVNRILNPPELADDYDYEDLPDFAAEVDQEMQAEYDDPYDQVQESVDEINQYRAEQAQPEPEEWDPWDYEEEDAA